MSLIYSIIIIIYSIIIFIFGNYSNRKKRRVKLFFFAPTFYFQISYKKYYVSNIKFDQIFDNIFDIYKYIYTYIS